MKQIVINHMIEIQVQKLLYQTADQFMVQNSILLDKLQDITDKLTIFINCDDNQMVFDYYIQKKDCSDMDTQYVDISDDESQYHKINVQQHLLELSRIYSEHELNQNVLMFSQSKNIINLITAIFNKISEIDNMNTQSDDIKADTNFISIYCDILQISSSLLFNSLVCVNQFNFQFFLPLMYNSRITNSEVIMQYVLPIIINVVEQPYNIEIILTQKQSDLAYFSYLIQNCKFLNIDQRDLINYQIIYFFTHAVYLMCDTLRQLQTIDDLQIAEIQHIFFFLMNIMVSDIKLPLKVYLNIINSLNIIECEDIQIIELVKKFVLNIFEHQQLKLHDKNDLQNKRSFVHVVQKLIYFCEDEFSNQLLMKFNIQQQLFAGEYHILQDMLDNNLSKKSEISVCQIVLSQLLLFQQQKFDFSKEFPYFCSIILKLENILRDDYEINQKFKYILQNFLNSGFISNFYQNIEIEEEKNIIILDSIFMCIEVFRFSNTKFVGELVQQLQNQTKGNYQQYCDILIDLEKETFQ